VFQKSEFNPNNTRFMSQWSVSLGFTHMDTASARYRQDRRAGTFIAAHEFEMIRTMEDSDNGQDMDKDTP
jgi:hypothetical protein